MVEGDYKKPDVIKVLHVIGIFAGGGVESVAMNYYEHIDKTRFRFDFVVHDDSPVHISDRIDTSNTTVYKVPAYDKNVFAFMKAIYDIVRRGDYNIVHSHMTTLGCFSLFPAWAAGAKVRILHGHNTTVKSETKRNIMKAILKPFSVFSANRYFACGGEVARWLYGASCVSDVVIIKNAVRLERFAYSDEVRRRLRSEYGLEGRFVIGHVGRFAYQKNHEYLLKILSGVVNQGIDAVLFLIGDGESKESFFAEAERSGLGNRIVCLGVRNDVNRLYSVMDVFCFPSRYEGLGIVAIEAQVNGVPVLLSDAVPEEAVVISDMTRRFGIGDEDADDWVREIIRIARGDVRRHDESTCESMRASGFDIETEVKRLEAVYESLAERAGAE